MTRELIGVPETGKDRIFVQQGGWTENWTPCRALLALEQAHVVGQALGRDLGARIADPLEAARVHQRDARLVLHGWELGLHGKALPERLQLLAGAEHEVDPAERVGARQEGLG